MSSLNHNGQTATAALNQQPIDHAKLSALIPKNLSSNKRAVIEQLVRRYQQNHLDR